MDGEPYDLFYNARELRLESKDIEQSGSQILLPKDSDTSRTIFQGLSHSTLGSEYAKASGRTACVFTHGRPSLDLPRSG